MDVHLFLRYGAKKDERPEKPPQYDEGAKRPMSRLSHACMRNISKLFKINCLYRFFCCTQNNKRPLYFLLVTKFSLSAIDF
jgi:hypothetical protein